MDDVLTAIDRATSGLCPCGADPRDGSAYCSDDCVPNYRGVHTSSDTDGTQMRWRPDLVTEVDDSGMELIHEFRRGRFHAQAFVYGHDAQPAGHLRLDDGHRFVSVNVDDQALSGNLNDIWDRLERELTDSQYAEPDPWADANWRLTDSEIRLVTNPAFHRRLSEAVDRVEEEVFATGVARSGEADPRLRGSVFVAPVEADLRNPSVWAEVGTVAVDGLNWGDTDTCSGPPVWGTTDRGPVTMTLDNRYGAFRPSFADVGTVTHYDIEIDAPEGLPLLDALVAVESEAALRERARILAEQSRGLAYSRLGEQIGWALEELGRTMRPALEALGRSFPQPRPEPDHPMLAAIEARRNRNTGPEQRLRPPRQLNPRRGR